MNEEVLACIYAAIDDANRDRDGKNPLPRSPDTPIYGSESDLDSLGLVNFILVVEDRLEEAFQRPIPLSDDQALSAETSPFRTVGSLAEYVEALLE